MNFVYKQYHYEDSNYARALTGITDENGNRFSTWTYNATGLATSSSHGSLGGLSYGDLVTALLDPNYESSTITDFTAMNYGVSDTTVTNPSGKKTIYHWKDGIYNGFLDDRLKVTDKVEGEASSSCVGTFQYIYYDSNGFVNQKVKLEDGGERIYYTNNLRGLHTRIEYGGLGLRIIKNNWHPTRQLIVDETIASGNSTDIDLVTTHNDYLSNDRLDLVTKTDLTTYTVPYASNGRTQVWDYTYTYWGVDEFTAVKTLTIDGPRTDVSDVSVYEYTDKGYLRSGR